MTAIWVLAFAASIHLAAAPSVLSAQVIQSTAREVLLEIAARDKHGRPVRNLRQDQFHVTENGAPVKITAFRLVERKEQEMPKARGSSGPRYDPGRQTHLISLVFDRLGMDGRRLSRQAALDLLGFAGGPNVYFSVFAVDQRVSVLQPFSDRAADVQRAIERATGGTPSEFAAQSANLKRALQSMVIPPEHAGLATAHAGEDGPPASNAGGADLATDRERSAMILSMLNFSESASRSQQGRSSIFSLLSLLGEQDRYPGIKTVVYFSEGIQVPVNLTPQFHSLIDTARRANVQVYAIDASGLSSTGRNGAAKAELEQALQTAAEEMDTQVNNHDREQKTAVTPDRVKSQERGEESMRANLQTCLAELAESTGGALIANTNDARTLLRRVADDVSSHYEIAYVPDIQRYDGRFRSIEVRVNRPDVRLHTRNGYFALPPAKAGDEGDTLHAYEVPLLQSLQEARASAAFPLHAGAFHFGPAADGVACALDVEVPLASVSFVQENHAGLYRMHLSALALIRNEDGAVIEKLSRDVPVEGPLDKLPAFRRGNFAWAEHRILPPGRYTLEAAVLDQNAGQLSTRKVSFLVPAATAGPAVSSVSLVRRVERDSGAADAQDPFHFSGGKVTPALSAAVPGGPGSMLSLYFVVYPNPAISRPPELRIELLRDGKLLSRSAPPLGRPELDGRIPYLTVSSTRALEPGMYQMRVRVSQGSAAAEQSAVFTLPPPRRPDRDLY